MNVEFIEDEQTFKVYDTAGGDINAWDTDKLPPEEWAGSIFEDAQNESPMLNFVKRRYDSPRKVTVPVQNHQAATWTSTAMADVRASAEMDYSAQGIVLDPVRYRTMTPITRDSLEEATWGVEQDVRNRLKNATLNEFNLLLYTTLDGTAMSSGNYQTAGESLTLTHTTHAVDYGTALNVDNIIDAAYAVRSTSKNYFKPNQCALSAAHMRDIIKESPMLSAAEFGKSDVIQGGIFVHALGMDWHIMGDMPQDSGSTDVAFVFDDRYTFIGNVPHEFEMIPNFRKETDEMEFFIYMKAAFAVGDKEALCVLHS